MLKKLTLFLGLCLCLTTAAFATEQPFTDIPPDSPHYKDTLWAYEEGIAKGRVDGTFGTDSTISARELVMMLGRVVDQENAVSYPDEYLDLLIERGVFLDTEANYIFSRQMTRERAAKYIYKTFGIDIYIDELYYYVDGFDTFAAEAAVKDGFLEDGVNIYGLMTRGETVRMIYELSKYAQESNAPEIVTDFKNNIDTCGKEQALTRYYLELEQIPKAIRDAFVQESWTISLDTERIAKFNNENHVRAAAITVYAEKTIYTKGPSVLAHELGHFLSYIIDENAWNEYQEEADALATVAGDYCKTNVLEFFAEAFATYLSHDKYRMEECAPKTYQYFVELEARNWGF